MVKQKIEIKTQDNITLVSVDGTMIYNVKKLILSAEEDHLPTLWIQIEAPDIEVSGDARVERR